MQQKWKMKFSTLKESSSFEEVAEVGSLEQFKGDSIDKIKMDDSGIALTATGDSYEANNGPAVATKEDITRSHMLHFMMQMM